MARFNTEYIAKLQHLNGRSAKQRTDAAIFKEEMQKQGRLAKELDLIE